MILKIGFDKLIEKINLDKTRRDNLISAHNTLREYLEKDEDIKNYLIKTKLQGSYATKTAIKPLSDGEYDVDIAVFLNLKDEEGNYIMSGYSVMNWLHDIICKYEDYQNKSEPRNRCVRIKYSNQLRLDVTPLHYNNDNLSYIPPDWNDTNPEGLIKWCTDKHAESFQKYYPIVKILKYWRDIQFGNGSHPKSIILLTLAGIYIDKNEERTLHESLIKTMKKMNKLFQENINVPEIFNPTLNSEKISERWDYFNYSNFKDKFDNATKKMEEALNEENEEKTIDILNSDELFNNNFPKALFEKINKDASSIAESMKKGELGIDKSATIGIGISNIITNVKPTKFYGEESK